MVIALIGLAIGLYFKNTVVYSFDFGYGNIVIRERGAVINEPLYARHGYNLVGWFFDEERTEENEVVFPLQSQTDIILYAKWEMEMFELPIVEIELLNGVNLSQVGREDYVNAKVSIINTEEEFLLDQLSAKFRGRGHGSWSYDKKGYRIKFNSKQEVFGEAESKHWVLVAGGHDNSLLRNNTAYSIVNDNLDAIEYTTSVHPVELFVNGNYHGVYSLFEHIRVDEGRVDISSEFGVLDTGYLLEYDGYSEEEGVEGINYFRVKGLKYPFTIKSPDPDDFIEKGLTEEQYKAQVVFIQDYMQTVVDSILNNNFETFSELADVDSFVDMYIIHELFKNTDTGWSSFYFYKKAGGKLYSGPTWDFDLSSGLSRGDSSFEGLYVGDKVEDFSNYTANELFVKLMKDSEEFKSMVKSRWLSVYEGIMETIEQVFDEAETYHESYARDARRYYNFNWKKEQEDLLEWLTNRIGWLTDWAGN